MTNTILNFLIIFLVISCSTDKPDFSKNNKDEFPQEINLPKLQLNDVSNLNLYSFNIDGKLINEGSSDIIEVGLIIGLSELPSINKNITKLILKTNSSGEFYNKITNIPPATKYYIRAYGINSDGIGYSNEVQFFSPTDNVYEGNITLSSQEEVIEFGEKNYSTINGSLKITGTVSDLTPLKSIIIINKAFEVKYTKNLKNLDGLNNLKITGNISAEGFFIEYNSSLESLSGLNNLERTRGETYITSNIGLTNLEGLNNLESIGGQFIIRDCNGLKNLSGLENLKLIGDSFYISSNSQLNEIYSLINLNYVHRRITIQNNNFLQNVDGLESIQSLEGISIINNDNLTNLNGIRNLTSVKEIITITSNDKLENLSVFRNIINVDYLYIEDNSSLINLEGFNNLKEIKYKLKIYKNSNLISLNGLENLTSLQQLDVQSNNSLINFEGLNGLINIKGNSYGITIGFNQKLNSFTGLEKLIYVDGSINIFNNINLENFCALKNLFFQGYHPGYINISSNLNNPTVETIIKECN